ncbi:immune inhibitor A domain-containing protein [Terrabacter sp. MAHUQ-38]|uniref:immune inhibitor A domain-containing protein n=1 Tax=unclassified Terrabacter TaxID=2630222 RepID=UPI00165D4075|nr:immune inhibitor A [Terrabacter sp. MAHUQ-38]
MNRAATTALVGSAVAAVIAAAAGPAGAVTTAAAPAAPSAAGAVTTAAAASGTGRSARPDNRPGPLTKTWVAQRKAAIDLVSKGQASVSSDGVVELADGKSVEVETVKTDKIFTILSEFGDQSAGRFGTVPGPLHNEIPKPDRTKDNSTTWAPDYDTAYYEGLFNGAGESMKGYYEALSNGQYSVVNTVSDWVKVPYNESYYGDNAVEDFGGSWQFISDTGNAWYDSQVAAGKTPAEIDAYLAQFDVWDRYDWDHDGNFDEADGYIDHFQAVHAGQGEDAGGGAQGEDAIWSHRWYVNGDDFGLTGPVLDGKDNFMGGSRIGQSKYWFGDYTTEPENGGLGVFSHEFGHDLGLPDYYDTAGGENGTAFWTLMSSGSWLGHGAAANEGIGTTPGLMGPEEKLFLGWLDHSTVAAGGSGSYTLNPAQLHVDGKDQAVKVDLPAKTVEKAYTTPVSGTHSWWTGSADDLNETLTRSVPSAGRVTVQAKAWYEIEAGFDYLYAEYSLDKGATWHRAGQAVDGDSSGKWTSLRWSYAANGPSMFRLRYQTDGGVHLAGAFIDDIVVRSGGTTLLTDDVESGADGWSATGLWKISTGTETGSFENYYLLENREYVGYDQTLAQGPYQFSEAYTRPDWVEFFRFQNGMLVWYVDHSVEDNNTSVHPGSGLALPVDARPAKFTYPDGSAPSNRRQPFDATFGLEATDATCLHKQVLSGKGKSQTVETVAACAPSTAGMPTFDDTEKDAYWSSTNPQNSVKVAGHGVKVTVTGDAGTDLTVSVTNPA